MVVALLQVYAVDWSPDGQRVSSGGKDKVLKMWANSYVAASAAAATELFFLFNQLYCSPLLFQDRKNCQKLELPAGGIFAHRMSLQ